MERFIRRQGLTGGSTNTHLLGTLCCCCECPRMWRRIAEAATTSAKASRELRCHNKVGISSSTSLVYYRPQTLILRGFFNCPEFLSTDNQKPSPAREYGRGAPCSSNVSVHVCLTNMSLRRSVEHKSGLNDIYLQKNTQHTF